MKEQTITPAGVMRRAWALLLAAALCLGLMPSAAWAEESEGAGTAPESAQASVGTSTLTIVYGLGWDGSADAKVNVTYPFAQDATLSDLLDAAVAAGDLKAYELNGYGYLSSVTFKDGTVAKGTEGGSLYWSNFVDGGYYEGSDTIQTQKLVDGQTYQFAWNSYPTAVPPTDWKPIVAQATSSSQLAGTPSSGSDDVVLPEDTGEASVLTQDVYRDLFENISASFVGSGEDWKVMELCAIGAASSIDRDALLANAVSSYNLVGTTNPQRSVIALTAAGIDPSHVTVGGETYDLLNKMATTQFNYTNSRIALLWAYASGSYDAPASALMTVDELLDSLAVSQLPDGGFANSGSTSDPDVTAMAIAALAPYQGRGSVNDVLTKALAALKSMQLSDGGFPRLGESVSNANSTAMASIALCAVGVDPAASWATASGATPMSALLSFANEGHTGFTYANGDAALATEQGFRALVAYQGLKNTGAAYNVYTQAKLGQAALPAEKQEESDVKPAGAPAADKKALAKTGDGSAPFAAGTAALALGALAAGIAATRRMRASDELSLRR